MGSFFSNVDSGLPEKQFAATAKANGYSSEVVERLAEAHQLCEAIEKLEPEFEALPEGEAKSAFWEAKLGPAVNIYGEKMRFVNMLMKQESSEGPLARTLRWASAEQKKHNRTGWLTSLVNMMMELMKVPY